MSINPKIYKLEGVIQHYSWGGNSFLPEFLKKKNEDKKPFAEYWMGAHQNAPSQVLLENGTRIALDQFIAQHAESILGAAVNQTFGRLPYLFKVLDVHDMLSIQVHPSKKATVLEFDAENKKGVPLNSADRNYKDDNHKPELMIACGDFWLLHGFKEPSALENVLSSVPELKFLLPVWKHSGYEGIYRKVMEMPQKEVDQQLKPLIDRIVPLYKKGTLKKESEDFWAARAFHTFCNDGIIDRGLFSIYLFNVVHLKKGEAIFQDAGILHAYLEGQNLELMANSDNVLRGGLTNKKVDVPELLKHVSFQPTIPHIIRGKDSGIKNEEAFITPAHDFELRKLVLNDKEETGFSCSTADILLVTEGKIEAEEGATVIHLASGETMIAINGAQLKLRSKGGAATVFRATVP